MDYTYTAQGGLKGINAPHNGDDPGGDSVTNRYGADGFSQVVNYHAGDFSRTGHPLDATEPASQVLDDVGLYDGTITSVVSRNEAPQQWREQGQVLSERYQYDATKRLVASRMAKLTSGSWNAT